MIARPMSLPTVPSLKLSTLPRVAPNSAQPRWRHRECSSVTSTRSGPCGAASPLPALGRSASGLRLPLDVVSSAAILRSPLARETADTVFDLCEVNAGKASFGHYDLTIYHDIGDGA